MIKELFGERGRSLIWQLFLSELKFRCRTSSNLGILLVIIYPILIFLVIYITLATYMKSYVEHYLVFLFYGIIMWSFFEKSTTNPLIILFNADLIKKAQFPKEMLIIGPIFLNLLCFLCEFIVLFAMMFIFKIALLRLLILPILLIPLVMLTMGILFVLTSISTFFPWLEQIWGPLVRLGFLATPIIYPVSIIPNKFIWVYNINPIGRLIVISRDYLIYGKPVDISLFLIITISIAVFFYIAYLFFKKLEPYFVDWI